MKRIIYLFLVISILLFSCESTPEALFSVNTNKPEVGKEVFFTNNSQNSKKFKWDFGDGYISYDKNPVHFYTGTGTFEVTLTAISKNGLEDKAVITMNVLIPTLLEIEVREYYDLYTVAGASVFLYSSIVDWDAQENIISEGFTDKDGIIVFAGLDPFVYYVDVWEKDHDNYELRDYDYQTYIRTPDVLPNKINRFVAWVDYVERSKGDGRRDRSIVIKKLERIIEGRGQPAIQYNTENWEELYNRRVNR